MRKTLLLASALVLCLVGNAAASIIFDLSPTNGITSRPADSGLGQGVFVNQTTSISDFGFFLDAPNGADLKFMIWGFRNTNLSLLFSQVITVGTFGGPEWVFLNPFNFLLNTQEYWFGVIADNNIDVGYIFPPISYNANFLIADQSGNTNYIDFLNPSPIAGGNAEIGLQLLGSPEPGSLILFGSGILGLAGTIRRKMI